MFLIFLVFRIFETKGFVDLVIPVQDLRVVGVLDQFQAMGSLGM